MSANNGDIFDRAGPNEVEDNRSGKLDRNEFVGSLARGLAVIRTFGEGHAQQSLSDVAKRAGITRSSARRFLHTLERLGYLHRRGRNFVLGPAVLDLGFAYLSSQGWWATAREAVEEAAQQLMGPCACGVRDGDEVVYIAHAVPFSASTFPRSSGTRLPLFVSAQGRIFLAQASEVEQDDYIARTKLVHVTPRTITDPRSFKHELAQIRKRDVSIIDQELQIGLRTVAVPIRDRRHHVVAAIGFSVFRPFSESEQPMESLINSLRSVAARIGENIPP